MSKDIRAQQQRIEQKELASQPAIESKALSILAKDGDAAAKKYLTDYSTTNSNDNVNAWWQFSDSLVIKYSNQIVTDAVNGTISNPGYPDWWLNETRYQYGPRVYNYEGLQQVPGISYVNQTAYTTPGNELNYIIQTQQPSGAGGHPLVPGLDNFLNWFKK